MLRKTAVAGAIALVASAMVVAAGAMSAAAGTTGPAKSSGNQIAGTWILTVHRPAPLPPLTSLQVFTRGGSVIESANDSSGAQRSPLYGAWERIEGRRYAGTGMFFRFDPQTGAHVGRIEINRTIQLSDGGQSMTVVGRATAFDLNGNVLSSFPVTAIGQRMHVEN